MKNIIRTLLATAIALGAVVTTASAGEGYIRGPNGRLTYYNNGQPGYFVVKRRKTVITRSYNDPMGRQLADVAIGLGALAVVGAIANNSAKTADHAFADACVQLGGKPFKDMQTGKALCKR